MGLFSVSHAQSDGISDEYESVPELPYDTGESGYATHALDRFSEYGHHSCNCGTESHNEVALSPLMTFKVCTEKRCQFSAIQARLLSEDRKSCVQDIESHRGPLWSNLDQFSRFKLILKLADRHAGRYDYHPLNLKKNPDREIAKWNQAKSAMMVCISAAETGESLDPMTISLANCEGHPSTQAGLGGMTREYYLKDVNSGDFVSEIPRYQGAGAKKLKKYDNLTTDPELQLEFMDYYLSTILKDRHRMPENLPVEWLANRYNTAIPSYGARVAACQKCVVNLLKKKPSSYTPSDVSTCMKDAQNHPSGKKTKTRHNKRHHRPSSGANS